MENKALNIASMNTDKSDSTSMIEREMIENTPFQAVKIENHWFVCWGEYQISGPYEDKEDCLEALQEKPYEIMTVVCIAVMDKRDRLKDMEKEIIGHVVKPPVE